MGIWLAGLSLRLVTLAAAALLELIYRVRELCSTPRILVYVAKEHNAGARAGRNQLSKDDVIDTAPAENRQPRDSTSSCIPRSKPARSGGSLVQV